MDILGCRVGVELRKAPELKLKPELNLTLELNLSPGQNLNTYTQAQADPEASPAPPP